MKGSFVVALILYFLLCLVHTLNLVPGRSLVNLARRARNLPATKKNHHLLDETNAISVSYPSAPVVYKSVVLKSPYKDMYVYLPSEAEPDHVFYCCVPL